MCIRDRVKGVRQRAFAFLFAAHRRPGGRPGRSVKQNGIALSSHLCPPPSFSKEMVRPFFSGGLCAGRGSFSKEMVSPFFIVSTSDPGPQNMVQNAPGHTGQHAVHNHRPRNDEHFRPHAGHQPLCLCQVNPKRFFYFPVEIRQEFFFILRSKPRNTFSDYICQILAF